MMMMMMIMMMMSVRKFISYGQPGVPSLSTTEVYAFWGVIFLSLLAVGCSSGFATSGDKEATLLQNVGACKDTFLLLTRVQVHCC